MSPTKLCLAGKLFTARESLVSDILAGDGKIAHLFYIVGKYSKDVEWGNIIQEPFEGKHKWWQKRRDLHVDTGRRRKKEGEDEWVWMKRKYKVEGTGRIRASKELKRGRVVGIKKKKKWGQMKRARESEGC
jgi:hypothetical protein